MAGDLLPTGVLHDLPADLREALRDVPKAAETWRDITPLAPNEWSYWVEDARRAAPSRVTQRRNVVPLGGDTRQTAPSRVTQRRNVELLGGDARQTAPSGQAIRRCGP